MRQALSSARRNIFPDTLEAAIKQKARWLTSISLAGWDRLGVAPGASAGCGYDRRTSLSALVLFAAHCATIGYGIALILEYLGLAFAPRHDAWVDAALAVTAF